MHAVHDHTLSELQIISEKHHDTSIFKYFDKTVSYGGRDLLKTMIRKPASTLSDTLSIQRLLKTISENINAWHVRVSHAYVASTEIYYSSNIAHTMSQDVIQHWFQTMTFAFRNPAEFSHIESGLTASLRVMQALRDTINGLQGYDIPEEIDKDFDFLRIFFDSKILKTYLKRSGEGPSKSAIFYLDYYLRNQHKKEFRKTLDIYYKLDAYTAIARASLEYGLCFPQFVEGDACFEVTDIWHPLVQNSTRNTFLLCGNPGLCILTGANTSGKTTFLKSSGIVAYLAHLGWPVPARAARLSFVDNLFTSIHLSDDLDLGYSHFYNEVMRVKEVAQALHNGERCHIIIDELFRGTNQQDALYCSKTVLDGFGNFKNSTFIVSTHLMELLENYLESPNVCFHCFKTTVTGGHFENTFLLEPGIASEKVGRLIMENAGIPELLNP